MEKVCVVMSTYNGEKYLREQIDSILTQRNIIVNLIIRDDGSSDNTINILKKYKENNNNIQIIKGKNVGYAKSFLSTLKEVKGKYRYFAFSDQDDVWEKDKLFVAVKKLKGQEKKHGVNYPLLYSCNLRLVDENLKPICELMPPKKSDFKKGRYLLDKYSYGCTMLFNKKLKDLATRELPPDSISHDNWVGLIAVFLGEFIFDRNCYINYRQHGTNVVGGYNGFVGTWKRRFKAIGKMKILSRAIVAKTVVNYFSDELSCEDKELLSVVVNYNKNFASKIKMLNNRELHRASIEKDILFRIQILLGLA